MRVRVLYFGMLKDAVGQAQEEINIADGAVVADLLDHCKRLHPPVANFERSLAVSVNQEYAHASMKLRDHDEIALLPPVSGGSAPRRAALVRDKIQSQQIVRQLQQPQDGALVVFEGVVRNHTRERRTLYLEYEAYEEMALKQLEALAEQAVREFAVRDARIVHRLGRLEIGETSVFIAVASAHRAAAFDACRWLIDTLKKTVPIWKKEFFAGGAVWADGEPFPEEISPGHVDPAVTKPAS